jgi:N-acetyltransferase
MATRVKRTYSARPRPTLPSSPPSTPTAGTKRTLPLHDHTSILNSPAKKRRVKSTTTALKPKPKQKPLTQLHFCIDTSILRTCPLCQFSYTKGAPDDESLHRTHCARVQRGMEWGKDEEREKEKAAVVEINTRVQLKDGKTGRIICMKADVGGKIGSKV